MEKIKYEEAYQKSKEYFNGDELSAKVFINKYALKDSEGNLYESTPEDMHHRISREIARIEKKYPNSLSEETIFQLIDHFKYIIPQGGPMMGIGNNIQVSSLSNCFVIGLEGSSDSYGGIIKIDEEQSQLMKRRGGVGHDISHLRPRGTAVNNPSLTSTGIVPFMERYSNSTREVAHEGRRGALMLSLSIKHPDSEAFIDAKMNKIKVTGANVSVRITDEFMQSVVENKPFCQKFPIDSSEPIVSKDINSVNLWKKIVHNAWKSAEPGILFWDTIIRESIPDCYSDLGYKTVSTNPCGEIPLCPYDSCRLLALNLFSYVKNPFTSESFFDYKLFKEHAQYAQRIMDDIIDLEIEKIDLILKKINNDPESKEIKRTELELWAKIRSKTLKGRRTGVGTTAEGDMLAALGFQYGTEKATSFSKEIHKILCLASYRSSVNMAKERGAFEIYDSKREENNPMIKRIKEADIDLYNDMVKYGRRNIACLTIPPTGTVSIMTQTTSGIEPVFMLAYKRRRKVNPDDKYAKVTFVDENGDSFEEYTVYHHKFLEWMKVNNIEIKDYSQEELDEIIKKSPYYKSTANEIDWLEKVKMQGAIQKWVDHSISVTINLPNSVSEEVVNDLFMNAWKEGCKGCTIYVDGSRSGILISNEKKDKKEKKADSIKSFQTRPQELEADIARFKNKKENWIAFIGLIGGKPYEIFTCMDSEEKGLQIPISITTGKIIKNFTNGIKHYDFQYMNESGEKITIEGISEKINQEYWNYAKLISGVLRYGMPIEKVLKLVNDLELNNDSIFNWKNGVKITLKKYIKDGVKAEGQKCKECNQESLIYVEGCLKCQNCGWSGCS